MIKIAARNIRIISPIRPKPFAVRLIALPKSSSFACELFEKYSSIVETDRTAEPFVFLDVFGKELSDEREQYYKMMLTLRLMISQRLLVSGKLSDPTVNGTYKSSVNVLISDALNYFRNSSNIIYNKLTDARKIVETFTAETPDDELKTAEHDSKLVSDILRFQFSEGEERYYRELLEKTVSETIYQNIGSYPVDTQSLIFRRFEYLDGKTEPSVGAGGQDIKQVGSDGNEFVTSERNETTDPREFTVLTYRSSARETEKDVVRVPEGEKTAPDAGNGSMRRGELAITRIMAGEGESFIPLMNTMMSGGAGYFADIVSKYVHRRTLPVSVIRPFIETVRRKNTRELFPLVTKALDILTSPEKSNVQERAVYEYAVSTVWLRRLMPGKPEPEEMFSRLDRKERTDVLVLAVERLMKISGKEAGKTIKYPDGKNRKRELSDIESALLWAVAQDERGTIINELSGMIKKNAVINRLARLYNSGVRENRHAAVIDRIERSLNTGKYLFNSSVQSYEPVRNSSTAYTYRRLPAVSMLLSAEKEGISVVRSVSSDESMRNSDETDAYGRLSAVSMLFPGRKDGTSGVRSVSSDASVLNNDKTDAYGRLSSVSMLLSAGKERAAGVRSISSDVLVRNSGAIDTYVRFTALSKLLSSGKEGAAAAMAVLPGIINLEKTAYSDIYIHPFSMTFRNNERLSDKSFGRVFFEKLIRRNIILSEIGAIGRELSKNMPAAGIITKRIDNIIKNTETAVGEAAVTDMEHGRSDVTVFSRISEKLRSVLPAYPAGRPGYRTGSADIVRDGSGESVIVPAYGRDAVFAAENAILREVSDIPASVRRIYEELADIVAADSYRTSGNVATPVFRTEADTKGAVRTVARLIGSLALPLKKDIIVTDEIPAPDLLYSVLTQSPAGYVGGSFRRLSVQNIRTLAKNLSLPSTSGNASRVETAETLNQTDTVPLNYRNVTLPSRQLPRQDRPVPTKADLVEQFGNLIEGMDPTKPLSSGRVIDGVTIGESEFEDTVEKLRQTTENTLNNTKLIEELSKKQREIEKKISKSSDIGNISEKVIKQLRMQLRMDSSRFMS